MDKPKVDLTGKKFGLLTIVGLSDIRSKNRAFLWDCICDCGNSCRVSYHHLKGTTKSCGCYKKYLNTQKKKIWLPEKVSNNILKIPLSQNKYALIDSEDLSIIKNHSWYCDSVGYARTRDGILMHRLIINCPKYFDVDHKNHDTLDNRKENIRICTRSENLGNKLYTKNKSGVKGVFIKKYKGENKIYSAISYKGSSHWLGYFNSVEEAQSAYINAGNKLFGTFFNKGV